MPLPDFANFAPFEALRRKMGAHALGDFQLAPQGSRLTPRQIKELGSEGIDVEDLDEIQILPDGTIAYKDYRVLVHIRDVNRYQSNHPSIDQLPRFHVSNCITLREMRSNNRFGRYVVATRDDGRFSINLKAPSGNWQPLLKELWICKNCLSELQYDGYSTDLPSMVRSEIFGGFSLKEFFSRYPKSPIHEPPSELDIGAKLNDYPPGWKERSAKLREAANWTCTNPQCQIQLQRHRKFLDVHHKNGQKADVSDGNLEVLCIGCHATQFQHAHIKRDRRYTEFMHLRRLGRL